MVEFWGEVNAALQFSLVVLIPITINEFLCLSLERRKNG